MSDEKDLEIQRLRIEVDSWKLAHDIWRNFAIEQSERIRNVLNLEPLLIEEIASEVIYWDLVIELLQIEPDSQ